MRNIEKNNKMTDKQIVRQRQRQADKEKQKDGQTRQKHSIYTHAFLYPCFMFFVDSFLLMEYRIKINQSLFKVFIHIIPFSDVIFPTLF